MGRKRQAQQAQRQDQPQSGKQYKASSNADAAVQDSRSDIETILALPRLARIALILVPTFAVVVILQPLIDTIYLRHFFSMETRDAAANVTAAIALGFFLIGWVLVVGYVGETPPARRLVRIYLYLAIVVVLFAVLWLGYLFLNNLRLAA